MTAFVKIIVVDDDDSIRESLTAFFEDEGFDVSAVASAEDALLIMKDRTFNAAVVDLRLPAMDGAEFIRRASRFRPDVCYLIFTGSACFELPEDLKMIPCVSNTVYQKPLLDLNILSEAVRILIAEKEDSNE